MLSHDTLVAVLAQLGAEIQITNTRGTNGPIMRTVIRRKDTKKLIHTIDVPGTNPLEAQQAAVEAVAKLHDIPTDTVSEVELLRRQMDEMQKTMNELNKRNVQTTTAAPEAPAPAPVETGSTTGPGHVTPPAETPAPVHRRGRPGTVAPITQ